MGTENIMSGDINNQSVEVLLMRIEGKIDRMGDRLDYYERDLSGLRARMHDLANDITPIVMLDLAARIRVTDQWKADHDSRITGLENIEQQRKGAAKFASLLWAVVGVAGTGSVAVLLRIMGAL